MPAARRCPPSRNAVPSTSLPRGMRRAGEGPARRAGELRDGRGLPGVLLRLSGCAFGLLMRRVLVRREFPAGAGAARTGAAGVLVGFAGGAFTLFVRRVLVRRERAR